MPSITLYLSAIAQQEAGNTYKKNAEYYPCAANRLYYEFENPPAALENIEPYSITVYQTLELIQTLPDHKYYSIPSVICYLPSGRIDIENNVFPDRRYDVGSVGSGSGGDINPQYSMTATRTVVINYSGKLLDILKNGLLVSTGTDAKFRMYGTASMPRAVVSYTSGDPLAVADSPKGYVNPAAEIVFSWRTTWSGFPLVNITQTSATLQWKNGASGTVNSIPISGSATSYTMAANTMPESSELYWRVSTVTAEGNSTSEWTQFRTQDTGAFVTAVSPNGVYVDGAKSVRFLWSFVSDSGTTQKAYDLQVKGSMDADYQTIKSETTPDTFADVSAGTLPGGVIQWRVRGYNQSGIAGDWCTPLQAVVIAAPNAPEVWVDSATCRPTVSWSSVGQLAYQVRIEGTYDSGTVFGTGKTFKIPEYLAPGTYPIGVRILGEYDYWSPWGYASATVENGASGESITLTASAQDGDALLSWTAVEDAEKYLVYRQGKRIAETDETQYTDPYAIGAVTYRVRAVFAGSDDYALSDPATVTLSVRTPRLITPGGSWIDLGLSTEPLPAPTIVATQAVTLMTYAGVEYPVPEIAPHKTRTYTCSPAFRTAQEAAVLESLLGQAVFLKDQNENSMTGVLTAVQLRPGSMYTVVSITVNEIGGVSL